MSLVVLLSITIDDTISIGFHLYLISSWMLVCSVFNNSYLCFYLQTGSACPSGKKESSQHLYCNVCWLARAQSKPLRQSNEFFDGHNSFKVSAPLQQRLLPHSPASRQHTFCVCSERDLSSHTLDGRHSDALLHEIKSFLAQRYEPTELTQTWSPAEQIDAFCLHSSISKHASDAFPSKPVGHLHEYTVGLRAILHNASYPQITPLLVHSVGVQLCPI